MTHNIQVQQQQPPQSLTSLSFLPSNGIPSLGGGNGLNGQNNGNNNNTVLVNGAENGVNNVQNSNPNGFDLDAAAANSGVPLSITTVTNGNGSANGQDPSISTTQVTIPKDVSFKLFFKIYFV